MDRITEGFVKTNMDLFTDIRATLKKAGINYDVRKMNHYVTLLTGSTIPYRCFEKETTTDNVTKKIRTFKVPIQCLGDLVKLVSANRI